MAANAKLARALRLSGRGGDEQPAESLRKRMARLRTAQLAERSSFDGQWGDLARFILPARSRRYIEGNNKGGKRMGDIVDSIATLSVRDLQAGMLAGMASPSRPWFALATDRPELAKDMDAKAWLDGLRLDMLRIMAESNFYTSLGMLFGDEAVFGTGAMGIFRDEQDVIRCEVYPVGSFTIGTDDAGRVCTFTRGFRMTVRQLVARFGEDALTKSTHEKWTKGQTEAWIDVNHAIAPNDDYMPNSRRMEHKRHLEVFWEACSADPKEQGGIEDKVLATAGYNAFPIIAARWELAGDDVYATMCPGMIALPDIKQLMTMTKFGANAMAAVVKPPMQHPASLAGTQISLVPGDSTEVQNTQDGNAIRPLIQVDPHLADLAVAIDKISNRIQAAFYRDLFRMLVDDTRDQRATAAEIIARSREKLSVLGPVLERHNDDVFEPVIELVYAIMLDDQLVPPPPESMANVPFSIEYLSEVAIAQRMTGLSGMEQHVGFLLSIVAQAPDLAPILDTVKWDAVAAEHGDSVGLAPKLQNDADDMAHIRDARAAQAQKMQQMQAMPAAAKAARDLAAAPTDTDNALTRLAGVN